MPYASIPEALTREVVLSGNRKLKVQEWPSAPAFRFSKFVGNLIKAVLTEAKAAGLNVRTMKWQVQKQDANGAPMFTTHVNDVTQAVTQTPVMEMDYELVANLVISAMAQLAESHGELMAALDAAVVIEPGSFDVTRTQLLVGDTLTLLRAVIEVNFARESSLGNLLGGLFPQQIPQAAGTPSTAPSPTPSGPPAQPPTAPLA